MNSPIKSLRRNSSGFTLVELLVVILIIVLVSAATLPSIISSFNHRKVSEAARILQATLVGARDAAIRANAPRGIRLLPDPVFTGIGNTALAANRMIPIEPAPDYSNGLVTIFDFNLPTGDPRITPGTDPRISINESVFADGAAATIPNAGTSWYWNIRQGDKIRFDDSGRYYTIAGPMVVGPVQYQGNLAGANPERFVNNGSTSVFGYTGPGSGAASPNPFTKSNLGGERLFLVNGEDDDNDGWVDEGFDGIDNDGDGIIDPGFNGIDDNGDGNIDEPAELFIGLNTNEGLNEYEPEKFIGSQLGTQFINRGYTIIRRPMVTERALEVALPEGIVIDMTTWDAPQAMAYNSITTANPSAPERSRLPVDPYSLFVDIMITPSGQVQVPSGGSGSVNTGANNPQSNQPFYHFWVAEREDVFPPLFGMWDRVTDPRSGVVTLYVPRANPSWSNGIRNLLPMPQDEGTIGDGVGSDYAPPTAYGVANDVYLKGDRRMVTLFTRTGQITTNEIETFSVADQNKPYYAPQLGTREVK